MQREGFVSRRFSDGDAALAAVAECLLDLILLDVVLPRESWYEICQEPRRDLGLREMKIVMMRTKGGAWRTARPSREEAGMTDRLISFSTPMVRALDGRKRRRGRCCPRQPLLWAPARPSHRPPGPVHREYFQSGVTAIRAPDASWTTQENDTRISTAARQLTLTAAPAH